MSDSLTQQVKIDLQQATTAGKLRLSRIRDIIQDAATQAVSEVKGGSQEIRTIAYDRINTVTEQVSAGWTNPDPAASTAASTIVVADSVATNSDQSNPEDSQSARTQKTPQDLWNAIAKNLQNRLWVKYQTQRNQLAQKLTNRYGDRYETLKQRFEGMVAWYNSVRDHGEVTGSSLVQQKQATLENQAANAGISVAKSEQEIRHRLTALLQDRTSK